MVSARRVLGRTARGLGYLAAAIILLAAVVVAILQTEWSTERLRRLVVAQANQYLTATLAIGRLEGSLIDGSPVARAGGCRYSGEHLSLIPGCLPMAAGLRYCRVHHASARGLAI